MQLVDAEKAGRLATVSSCPACCLEDADRREDSTDPLRDTKLLNSGKRSCLHRDTRVAWVLSRAHSATSGQSAPAQRRSKRKMNLTPMPTRRQNDWSAPLPSASPPATSVEPLLHGPSPIQVWVQVLLPDWTRKIDAAVGARDQGLEVPLFREFLLRMIIGQQDSMSLTSIGTRKGS